MKPADLRAIVAKMTGVMVVADKSCRISIRDDDGDEVSDVFLDHFRNAAGIVALRNHADALLDLAAAVDRVLAASDPETEAPLHRELRAARGRLEVVK